MRAMITIRLTALTLGLAATTAGAQQVQPQGRAPAKAAALTAAQQIASAVLPVPSEFRADATVLGYGADGTLTTLRKGSGAFVCLADNPAQQRFHVACYHTSLEPFMARGRALRAQGITKHEQIDSVRFAEVKSGKLAMPAGPAALYSITGDDGSYDVATSQVKGGRPLFVIYVAGATAESTGLSARPQEGTPWIMYPGTPKAHVMFVPRM